ncbi:MAG TPA: hypothetical protein DCQ43_08120 [Treponema sp.]|nr:hypothetical protein [Treponema sp.]
MTFDLHSTPCFGVAGNFTGHLEQAGEARDFANVKTVEANAPKALFPTYIPIAQGMCIDENAVPVFLHNFPFDSEKIIFPKGEQKIQIEPECALVCEVLWKAGRVVSLEPKAFAASNDCSIRKEGAKKISVKKNWGPSSKGFSSNAIDIDSYAPGGILDRYRIASFLVRSSDVFAYGEDSAVRDYSYIYAKLTDWIVDRLNFQQDEGPAENINAYLQHAGCPSQIMVSIGATRYTDFGEHNFLQCGDKAVVVLYPEDKYSSQEIAQRVKEGSLSAKDISALVQEVVV